MKKIYSLLILFIILITSCEKDPLPTPIPPKNLPTTQFNLYGDWKLIDGDIYVESELTHELVSYHHFSNTKKISSLRYEGSIYMIEDIEINKTVWTFIKPKKTIGIGVFLINKDSLNPYGLNITNSFSTIIEYPNRNIPVKIGGSAKPFITFDYNPNDSTVKFYIHDAYVNINYQSYSYFNILKFKKIK